MDDIGYLLQYLADHGIKAELAPNGLILATADYMRDGREGSEQQHINPTLRAVRAWLGY